MQSLPCCLALLPCLVTCCHRKWPYFVTPASYMWPPSLRKKKWQFVFSVMSAGLHDWQARTCQSDVTNADVMTSVLAGARWAEVEGCSSTSSAEATRTCMTSRTNHFLRHTWRQSSLWQMPAPETSARYVMTSKVTSQSNDRCSLVNQSQKWLSEAARTLIFGREKTFSLRFYALFYASLVAHIVKTREEGRQQGKARQGNKARQHGKDCIFHHAHRYTTRRPQAWNWT